MQRVGRVARQQPSSLVPGPRGQPSYFGGARRDALLPPLLNFALLQWYYRHGLLYRRSVEKCRLPS